MPRPRVIPTDGLPDSKAAAASVDGTIIYVRADLTGIRRSTAIWQARRKARQVRLDQQRRGLRTLVPGLLAAFRSARRSLPHAAPAAAASGAVLLAAGAALTFTLAPAHSRPAAGAPGSRPAAAAVAVPRGHQAGRAKTSPRSLSPPEGAGTAGQPAGGTQAAPGRHLVTGVTGTVHQVTSGVTKAAHQVTGTVAGAVHHLAQAVTGTAGKAAKTTGGALGTAGKTAGGLLSAGRSRAPVAFPRAHLPGLLSLP